MNIPLVSVIVPVWNSARFLPECLDSLLAQTLNKIEIICINDASTDESLQILRHYAAGDQRIRVFTLEINHRPGGARNFGCDQARGAYIGFVDSDDLVSPDYFENLYRAMLTHNADIVFTSYTVFDDSTREVAFGWQGNMVQRLRHRLVHNVRGFRKAFGQGWEQSRDFSGSRLELSMFPTVVNKLYRRTLLEKIRFAENLLYEDMLFMPQVLYHAVRVFSCPGGGYYYRRNPGSITRRTDFGDLLQKLVVAGSLDQWVRQQDMEKAECDRYEKLVQRKYRQGIKSLAKRILIWSPKRIRAVKDLIPERQFLYFYRKVLLTLAVKVFLLLLLITLAMRLNWKSIWLYK